MKRNSGGLLEGARVYLSGPMDFVASRAEEQKSGWRARVGQFLRAMGAIVFDPWHKPQVRGLHGYGREGEKTSTDREKWTFEDSRAGAAVRAGLTGKYWQTLHIDLRMVDTSDFTIAYCPTNVYSVGTPHEIALCRSQRKPVLFVSPPVVVPSLAALGRHLAGDKEGTALFEQLQREFPIKENPEGIPSLWYMPLVGGQSFFDGFGFESGYRRRFRWKESALDQRERDYPPRRPLLSFLERLARRLPRKWSNQRRRFVLNDDWLLWDLRSPLDSPVKDARRR